MPVREQYRFKIDEVYEKPPNVRTECTNDELRNVAWADGYGLFKKGIRSHLKLAQHGRCAFCRCIIPIGTCDPTLEHLLSKHDYPQFISRSDNIVYCCWICNRSKKKRNTLTNPSVDKKLQPFPHISEDYCIISPYYDDYESYIDFLDEVIIVPVGDSAKGPNTILYYSLTRPVLAEERAREFKLDQLDIYEKLMIEIARSGDNQDLINQILAVIDEIPNWIIN